jgi:hypothetical protein
LPFVLLQKTKRPTVGEASYGAEAGDALALFIFPPLPVFSATQVVI